MVTISESQGKFPTPSRDRQLAHEASRGKSIPSIRPRASSSPCAEKSPHTPRQNHLLAALPTADYAFFAAQLELVPLPLGDILYEPGGQQRYAYFPTTSIVSLHYVTETGASAETAGVGNEGVVGVSLFLGGNTTPSAAVVQTAGHAYRLEGRLLKREFARAGAMRGLLLRYTQALITQMIQTAACNRHHSVEQQLCRWLLLTLDRLPGGELTMTQELVASMLGVRRESVTEAAGKLQHAGLIHNRRGHIAVLDRSGLETHVCECYAVVKNELSRLMTDVKQQSVAAKQHTVTRLFTPELVLRRTAES
jgi:CRP-like cAMP-binding protein